MSTKVLTVQTYTSGIGVSEFAPATREGYGFIGWYVDQAAITSITEDMEGDITLHAQWEEITPDTPLDPRDEEPTDPDTEEPTDPDTETPTESGTETPSNPVDKDGELPQTGVSNLTIIVAGLTITIGGLVVLASQLKKRENEI